MFIAIDYIQKTNIILPFSQPKRIVVKNVQYSIFRQFFTHFYFFLFIQPQLLLHFFFPFSFFVAVCLLLCFYSFFPISTPCIFSKHFYTFYVSYVSYFFLCFVNKNTRYTILNKKIICFFLRKKKEKNFPKKSYYDIKLLCNLYKIIYMCLPSYQK